MLQILDTYFTDELKPSPFHTLIETVEVSDRISASVYTDWPSKMAIIQVDGKPVLRENFIDNIVEYKNSFSETKVDFLLALVDE